MELNEKYSTDLEALKELPPSEEVSEQIIDRIMEYCFSHENVITCEDVPMDPVVIKEMIADELLEMMTYFLTDDHRNAIVRYHAQGMSTAEAVSALMKADTVIDELANTMDAQELRQELIHRFAYLKPGSGRWPEKKYGDLWRQTRTAYQQEIQDIPFTSTAEQVKVLSEHVQKVMAELNKGLPHKSYIPLMNTLIKLVNSLHKLTSEKPQRGKMPDVLIVLPTPEQIKMLPPEQIAMLHDTEAFISTLEQALQTLQQKPNKEQAALPNPEEAHQDSERYNVN